jgi:CIC family chloride channel protein
MDTYAGGDRATKQQRKPCLDELGDFTTTFRVIPICLLAIGIGLVSTGVAWLLLKLIGLFTNLATFETHPGRAIRIDKRWR